MHFLYTLRALFNRIRAYTSPAPSSTDSTTPPHAAKLEITYQDELSISTYNVTSRYADTLKELDTVSYINMWFALTHHIIHTATNSTHRIALRYAAEVAAQMLAGLSLIPDEKPSTDSKTDPDSHRSVFLEHDITKN